ncbi:hypothetical protein [Luteimonas lutimaris]|uniref:DUF4124 domain-containing protein n=1 Tax=Luteimonas lutimaris TaxID=698645 RepID=A0ABP7MAL9_9GAMM|nr:hypothetical protein [Luteimonas sp.]
MKWSSLLFASLLLCTCAPHARAEGFHKCGGEGGAVAYRSQTCLPGETLLATLEPEPEFSAQRNDAERNSTAPAPRPKPARNADRRERSHATQRLQGSRKPRAKKNPCAAAKLARDDFQRRRGIRITMVELSRWNHRVYDACK